LLTELRARGIRVELSEDGCNLDVEPASLLSEADAEALRNAKAALVELLARAGAPATAPEPKPERIAAVWPRARNRPEAVARYHFRKLAGEHPWRHPYAPALSFGFEEFSLPILAGHVIEMLRNEGAPEERIASVLDGSAADLDELYQTAFGWVRRAVDRLAASR
jgi:hypothetical protein